MEEEIKKLREAGFTDSDIQAFVNDQKSRAGQPQPVDPAQVDATQPPMVDERVPTYGAPPGTSMMETAGTVGAAAAPYAAGAALTAGGIYGASVAKQGFNAMKAASEARTAQANAQMATAQGLQQRAEQRLAAQAARAVPTTPQILNAGGQPIRPVAPVAPTAAPPVTPPAATAQAPSVMQRGAEIAQRMREIAASKVAPVAEAAAPFARAAGGIAAMAMPGNIGQNYPFPQKGPMRGQEINPATGRPWTPAELQQYNQAY
jgi:hypothetical protein